MQIRVQQYAQQIPLGVHALCLELDLVPVPYRHYVAVTGAVRSARLVGTQQNSVV